MPTRLGSTTTGGAIGSVASVTVSVLVPAGVHRCLVLGLAISPTTYTVTVSRSVTWNSVAMTRLGIQEYLGGASVTGKTDAVELWYLLDASLPAADTTANLVVTANGENQDFGLGVQTWGGVDQATPWGAFTGNWTAADASPTLSVASSNGDVIDIVDCYVNTTFTVTPTYSLLWKVENNGSDSSRGQSSRTSVGTSTQIGWTLSAAANWWYGAAQLNAEPGRDTLMGQAHQMAPMGLGA